MSIRQKYVRRRGRRWLSLSLTLVLAACACQRAEDAARGPVTVVLQYAPASQVADTIENLVRRHRPRRETRSVAAIPGTNSLVVNAQGGELQEILELIDRLDSGPGPDVGPITDGCIMWMPDALTNGAKLRAMIEAMEEVPPPARGASSRF